MEHRLSQRRKISLDALIYYRQGHRVVKGKIRDIGQEGMFVETGSANFPKDSTLDVEFVIKTATMRRRFRVPALVIHRSGRGVGLMFRALDPEVFHTLQALESGTLATIQ